MNAENPTELNDRGADLYTEGKFAEALTFFEKALALEPGYGKAWVNRANCLFSLERFGEAVNSYRRAVDVSPLFPEGWVSRAVAEQRLGLSADAVSSFQMFLGLADQQKHRETVQKANQSLKELSGLGFRMKDPQTFLWMVKGYRLVAEQKQFDKAIPCFDNALALFPQYGLGFHCKAGCLAALNRLDDAIASWKRAVALEPGNAIYWYNLGVMYGKKRLFDEALSCYTSAVGADGFHMEAWNNRGRVLGMLRRVDEARESFGKALEVWPSSAVTWFNKALLEDAAGMQGEAAVSYSRFVEHALSVPDRFRDQLAHAGKRLDELMPPVGEEPSEVRKAEEPARKEAGPVRAVTPAAAQESLDLANKAYDLLSEGDYERAMKCAELALTLDDRNDLAWINKGTILYNTAHEAYRYDRERLDQALACFDTAIRINPREPLGHLNKGLCLNDIGKYPAAIASFEKAISLDPSNAVAWCHKGNSYRAAGNFQEAIHCCDTAIGLAPDFPLPWYFKAVSQMSLERKDEALKCFQGFLDREGDGASVLAQDARKRIAELKGA